MTDHPRPPLPSAEEEPQLLSQLLRWWTLARRRPLVPVATALLCGALMWANRARQPEVFQAEGLVQMGMNAGVTMDPGEYVLWVAGRERTINTQERLLTSDPVVERAMQELGRDVPTGAARRAALRDFLAGVEVTPLEKTYLVEVVAKNGDPEEAALRVNALMDAFIPFTNKFLVSGYVAMERQLEDEMERLRAGLLQAELELERFYRRSGHMEFGQRRQTLHARQRELDTRLTELRLRRAALEAERDMLEAGLSQPMGEQGLELLLAGLSGDSLAARLEPLARQRAELVRLRSELRPEHPEAIALAEQIAGQEKALTGIAEAAVSSLRMREQAAQAEEAKLAQLLDELSKELSELDRLDGEHRNLERDLLRFDRELEAVRQRHLRTESRTSSDSGTTVVVSRAEAPAHPLPRRILGHVAGASLLGLFAGLFLLVAWERVEDSFSSEEAARQLGLPILGRVPKVDDLKHDAVVLQDGSSRAAEAFRDVRTQVAAALATPRAAILVTSGGPGVGKTFVSINLGAALARGGARTLLVEGDMRRPRLQRALGMSHERGLSDLLSGEGTLAELAQPTEEEGLDLLPCGKRPSSSADLLAGDAFERLIKEALETYDRVLIDSPPADVVSDGTLMAPHVDGCLLVVRLHHSRQRASTRALEQVQAVGGRCLGVVLNGLTALDEGYGLGYGYSGYRYAYHSPGDDPAGAS